MAKKKSDDPSEMSNKERIAKVERIFVVYPRLKNLLDQIEHCRTHSKIAAEPQCMFVGGLQGAGKTTLQKHYVSQFPRILHENGITVPALRATVPNRATDKTLVTALLRSLEDPAAEKGSADNQTARLRGFMNDCGVDVTLLDEFQHFVDKDSKKVLKTVSDWLKNLIDETWKPIILWGMPYADLILDAEGNEQLRRRFSIRATLDPFGWGNEREKTEFRLFLREIEKLLPLPDPSRLPEETMSFRFYCATNGRVGKVMKVVRRAAELGIVRSLPKLDLDVLAEAYEERLRHEQPNHENAFCVERSKLKVVSFEEFVPDFGVTNGRSKPGAGRERASDVLKKKR